jgi:serine protease Do
VIRQSLPAVRNATFNVMLPRDKLPGEPEIAKFLPRPSGTGFFVSPDGWFVTAAHVVYHKGKPADVRRMYLFKPSYPGSEGAIFSNVKHVDVRTDNDIALLKFDFADHAAQKWLAGRDTFPYIEISTKIIEEGAPVYAFGFPNAMYFVTEGKNLPNQLPPRLVDELRAENPQAFDWDAVGMVPAESRVTSAILAAQDFREYLPFSGAYPPIKYVIDKALNFGNSGGPIIATESGKVFAVCSGFRDMYMPQRHLGDDAPPVAVPPLYGYVESLSNQPILDVLRKYGIPICDE